MNTPHRENERLTSAALRAILICSLLLSVVLFATPATHASPPAPDSNSFGLVKLPPAALTAPVLFDDAQVSAGGPKMEGALGQLAATSRTSKTEAYGFAQSQQMRLSGDRVQVLITTDAERADSAAEAVAAAGGEVTGRANGDTWLQAWAPVSALETIAADPSVDYVSRPAEALTMATTEGAAAINAPAWHSAGKVGAGVRVAIIDAGFQGYPGLLGTELPASVTVKNFVDGENDSQANGTTVHGTACAEVVHDIAPSAIVYLAKVGTNVDLEEAVNWAKAQNVNIISTSLGWYNLTPGDGTGFFANLVQSARNSGIFWATAAGNDREAHWGGAFNGDANGYHQFAGSQVVDFFGTGDGSTAYLIPSGYPIRVYLRWDDWSAKNQDYDLYIVRWNGSEWQVVGSSLTRQTGGAGQTPTEYVGVLSSGSSAPYGLAIKRYSSSRNVNLEVFAPKVARLDNLVIARSLANLADAPAAMTVAALDVSSPYAQEYYSSEGPANGPGGTATGGATKPDISGFANVSTASYPDPNAKFNGTSSATPHVAGAAALVKGAYPAYTPAQIQGFLEGRAIDMGNAGKDTLFGWGRLYLGTPPGNIPLSHKTYLPLVSKALEAPTLNAISNPGNQANYTLGWSAVATATSYQLQEAAADTFAGAALVYAGPATSWQASGKVPGTYYYRVRTVSAKATSGWSNVQSTSVAAPSSWQTILSDSFEGSFPGPWQLRKFGSYDWGKSACRAFSGGYSAWAVGGGGISCGANYPDYITTWMVYGPFSLADATASDLQFKAWINTAVENDTLCSLASVDNGKFYGDCWTGNSGGWRDMSLDLSNVYTIGDLRGQSQVWIAFLFDTDDSTNYGEGSYVDDAVLRKCVGVPCTGGAPAAQSLNSQFEVSPAVMERPK